MPKVKVTGQRLESCLSNNSKTTAANLMSNGFLCRAQDFGSYAQGLGHNQVTGQNCI